MEIISLNLQSLISNLLEANLKHNLSSYKRNRNALLHVRRNVSRKPMLGQVELNLNPPVRRRLADALTML